ncbi:GspH/FimT family pseudopilin [Chromobacterium sp. ATCC 53434]|uniref:GspH/FimT family pseudopilin n=1 Tax=Chromobacterium sp. (strain ATCC 53434 / SC 14030) TaxID=2059672 RepID=UPI0013050CD4|nr:GspH/FimT family pseudopilin [Chromobacterium sp. ATCC 53434]
MGRMHQAGLTWLELMTVLAIAAVLACLAWPELAAARERQSLRGHALALLGGLHHARAAALQRNRPVYLCAANLKVNRELQGCLPPQRGDSQSWPEGALVFADKGAGNGRYDSGERLRLAMFDGGRIDVSGPTRLLTLSGEGRLQAARPLVFQLRGRRQCLRLTVAADGRGRLGEIGDGCA